MASSKALTLAEYERQILARELHDHAVQTLQQMNMQAGICQQYLEHGMTDDLQAELESLEAQTRKASNELRAVISELRQPPGLADGGFNAGLQAVLQQHQAQDGPPVTVQGQPKFKLPHAIALVFLRILQEGLKNIRHHAHAQAVTLNVALTAESLTLTLQDDGQGFDMNEWEARSERDRGLGIETMRLRAKLIRAKFQLDSTPDAGTSLTLSLSK
jgi:signal transduction histidine kinase